jgi:hypothetical protein
MMKAVYRATGRKVNEDTLLASFSSPTSIVLFIQASYSLAAAKSRLDQRFLKKMSETEDKDELLAKLLPLLANRGMVRVWAQSNAPYSNSNLADECRAIMSDHGNRETFRAYLQSNPLVHATVETLLSHLAMTANTKWQDTPQLVHALSRRGWHIARWLPTFLIVDGPLGRFLKAADSPLNKLLRTQHASYPCLHKPETLSTMNSLGRFATELDTGLLSGKLVIKND